MMSVLKMGYLSKLMGKNINNSCYQSHHCKQALSNGDENAKRAGLESTKPSSDCMSFSNSYIPFVGLILVGETFQKYSKGDVIYDCVWEDFMKCELVQKEDMIRRLSLRKILVVGYMKLSSSQW